MKSKTYFKIGLLLIYTGGLLALVAKCNGQPSEAPQQQEQSFDRHLALLDGDELGQKPVKISMTLHADHRRPGDRRGTPRRRSEEQVPPVLTCSLVDLSGSTAFYKVYPPSPQTIRLALNATVQAGGTFGVGIIHGSPSDPLIRRTFSTPEPLPEGEDTSKDVFTRSRQRKAYRKALPAWQEREEQRRRDNTSLAEGFVIDYEKFLNGEWDANASNVWDSVKRCENMLMEDPHHWTSGNRPAPLRYLVLVTDGRANAGRLGYEPLDPSITVLAVSGIQGLGDLAQIPGIRYFESSDAAYRFIASHAKQGGAR